MYGLRNKDSTEYTGIETYIDNMIDSDDVTWIPILRSITASQTEDDQNNEVENKINQIIKELELLDKMVQSKN